MHIVRIGDGSTEPHSADAIGAKAANLARMAALGLPVPPAFVLPVKLCAAIIDNDAHAERDLRDGLKEGIEFLERETGKRFGDRRQPLLVSVRSGAARSMPGMLDTVLDVGCTSAAVQGLIRTHRTARARVGLPAALSRELRRNRVGLRSRVIRSAPCRADRRRNCRRRPRTRQRGARTSGRGRTGLDRRPDDGWLEDADGATRRRGQGRLSIVDERAGAILSSSAEARRSPRHRRHGSGHGIRQWRTYVRSRRRVLARSLHRAAAPHDRPCARCPGRRRRLGPPNARHRRDDCPRCCRRSRPNSKIFSSGSSGNSATCRISNSPSKTENSGFSRRGPQSGRRARRCESPSISCTRN